MSYHRRLLGQAKMLLALPWFCYASIYLWKCPRLAAGATLPLALCVEWKVGACAGVVWR